MFELNPTQYQLAISLFKSLDYHLAVRSAIAGKLPIRFFVDDLDCPTLGLIWAKKRIYLAGAEPYTDSETRLSAPLWRLVQDTIYPQALASGLPALVFYYAPDSWEKGMIEILSGRQIIPAAREHYTLSALPSGWHERIPDGFTLHTVDTGLLKSSGLRNLDGLIAEIQSEGEPVESFLDDRLGVCALVGDEIAGWCLSEYNLEDCCEIGIETLEPYQRRGLGVAMTCALVELANSRGIFHIGWDCYRDNIPSVASARKSGFIRDHGYPSLVCLLDPVAA